MIIVENYHYLQETCKNPDKEERNLYEVQTSAQTDHNRVALKSAFHRGRVSVAVDSAAFLSSILSARQNEPQATCAVADGYKMGNATGTITHSQQRVQFYLNIEWWQREQSTSRLCVIGCFGRV